MGVNSKFPGNFKFPGNLKKIPPFEYNSGRVIDENSQLLRVYQIDLAPFHRSSRVNR